MKTGFWIVLYIVFMFLMCALAAIALNKLEELLPFEFCKVFALVLLSLVTIGAISCLSVFVYWFFNPNVSYRFSKKHESLWFPVYLGTSFTCFGILYTGISKVLWFIPANPLDFRAGTTFLLTFALTFFLVYVFYKFEQIRQEHAWLKFDFEIQKEMKEFKYLTESQLKEKIAEFQQRCEKLYGILSPTQEMELFCLDKVIIELEKSINNLKRKNLLEVTRR